MTKFPRNGPKNVMGSSGSQTLIVATAFLKFFTEGPLGYLWLLGAILVQIIYIFWNSSAQNAFKIPLVGAFSVVKVEIFVF